MVVQNRTRGREKAKEFVQFSAGLSDLSEVIFGPEGTAEVEVWFGLPQISLREGSFPHSFLYRI